jgi:NDP-sugar pyrophosphorylase family protein
MRLIDASRSRYRELFSGLSPGDEWRLLARLPDYILRSPATNLGRVDSAAIVDGRVRVHAGAHVMAGAVIEGPAIVGEGAVIRPGAYLRGCVLIGDRVVIGHGSEIKNSILLEDSTAAHFAYVGDSVVGRGVLIGAGTKLANARLDEGQVSLAAPAGRIRTGLERLGSIVGDRARIGCNCVLNPGSVLAPGVRIPPLSAVQGYVAGKDFPERSGRDEGSRAERNA